MFLGDQHSAARLKEDRLYHERGGEYTGDVWRSSRVPIPQEQNMTFDLAGLGEPEPEAMPYLDYDPLAELEQ